MLTSRSIGVASFVLVMACGRAPDRDVVADGAPPGLDADARDDAARAPVDVACAERYVGTRQLGTSGDDAALAVAMGPHGELVIGGYERGVAGTTNIEPAGDAIGVVTAIDATGAPLWRTTIDTAGADVVEAVGFARDGRLAIAGRTDGAIAGATNQGQFDALVGTLDADGTLTALHQRGTERPEHPTRVAVGADGRLVVAGFDDIYVPSNYVDAWEDGIAISLELDPGGGARTFFDWRADSKPSDRLTGLAVDPDGSIFVSGVVTSGVDRGTFVRRLDAAGDVVWTRTISRSGVDVVNALAISPAGELYAAGATGQRLGAESFGDQDAFLFVLDKATGSTRRVTQAGGPASDYPTALAVDREGTATIVGQTLGTIDPAHPHAGGIDAFVLTIGPDGAVANVWQTGVAGDHLATDVAVDPCGRAAVVGFTDGALAAPLGRRDGFLIVRRPSP